MSEIKRITSVRVDDITRTALNHNFKLLYEQQRFPGTGSSYLQIEADGTLVLIGDATVWEDLRFPATQIRVNPATLKPDFDEDNIGYLFAPASTETVLVIAQMPHGWKLESTIEPHVHWSPTTTGTGNVLWRLEYKWVSINGSNPGTWTTVDLLAAAGGESLKHQISGFTGLDGTGKGLSSIISMKLSRVGGDATDTYAADALLKEFDIHYEIDTMGSREELVK
jgi:hypothetical protein